MNKSLQDEIKASYISKNASNLAKDSLENLRTVSLLSLAINLIFTVVILRFLVDDWVVQLVFVYLYAIFIITAFLSNKLINKHQFHLKFVNRMTLAFLYLMGAGLIFMSVYVDNVIIPLFFILFLVLYPTLFLLKEAQMIMFIVLSGIIFLLSAFLFSNLDQETFLIIVFIILVSQVIGLPINWMVLRLRKKELYLKELFIAYSHLDELTKLPNRRAFNLHIEKIFNYNKENHIPLGVALIDIDDFKLYNDFYGQLEGDNILEKLGMIIQSQVNEHTFFARFGGEEFIGVFTSQSDQEIYKTLHHIKQDLKALNIKNSHNDQPLSVSIGLCNEIKLNEVNYMKLIDNADIALYKAKIYGKDKIELYTEENSTSSN